MRLCVLPFNGMINKHAFSFRSTHSESAETNFGFETIKESDKIKKVFEVFQSVSPKYDAMNDAMSFGIHRLWKDQFVRNLGPTPGSKILDVAGGTGDIAFRMLDKLMTAEDQEAVNLIYPTNPTDFVRSSISNAMDAASAGSKTAPEDVTSVADNVAVAAAENDDDDDDLLDPNLTENSFELNQRSAASMEAIRQKTDKLSSNLDASEESLLEAASDDENEPEKGGLFVAGNIAGAKAEEVSLHGFSSTELGKHLQNDPHFVTEPEAKDDDSDSEIEIVPVAPPDFDQQAFDVQSLHDTLEDAAHDDDDDFPDLIIGDDPHFAVQEVSDIQVPHDSSSSSDESDESTATSVVRTGKFPKREPKPLMEMLHSDPNVHAEGFSHVDLDIREMEEDISFDQKQLKVSPTYHDDKFSETSPDLANFMTDIEEGLEGFGMISDEGMSHDEELNVEHELFENVLPSGSHVTVLDLSPKMLEEGKTKAEEQGYTAGISWVEGNAEELPFPEDTFDAYTIAFGMRNCTHIDRVLSEAYRVLKPGGRFLCLEFSKVENPLLRQAYDMYSFQLIPVMGQIIAGDWKSYQYLVESIRVFPDQKEFSDMIQDVGFRMVHHVNLNMGIAAIHSGFKV